MADGTMQVASAEAIASGIRSFEKGIAAFEQAFGSMGDDLANAIGSLDQLSSVFGALSEAGGLSELERLDGAVQDIRETAAAITGDLGRIDAAAAQLVTASREADRTVDDLRSIVGFIGMTALNARILSGELYPPHPAVNAFVTHLTEMSGRIGDAHGEIHKTFETMLRIAGQIDSRSSRIDTHLKTRLLAPVEVLLRDLAADMAHHRKNAARSDTVAGLWTEISGGVSSAIVQLQFGDTTRQRFEHILDILHQADRHESGDPVLAAALRELARALLDHATGICQKAGRELVRSLDKVGRATTTAITETAALYAAGRGAGGNVARGGSASGIDTAATAVLTDIAALTELTSSLDSATTEIGRQQNAIAYAAFQSRLSGLNAAITCARLGERGTALRELARWLRAATEDCESSSATLREQVADVLARSGELGGDRLSGIDTRIALVANRATEVEQGLGQMETLLGESSTLFDLLRSGLDATLADCRSRAAELEGQLSPMNRLVRALGESGARLPLDRGNGRYVQIFGAIEKTFTIADERNIYRRVIWNDTTQEAEVAEQSLDDMFF